MKALENIKKLYDSTIMLVPAEGSEVNMAVIPKRKSEVDMLFEEAIKELEALQSRSCATCKNKDIGRHEICPIREPLERQWLGYDEETFSCNQWRAKDDS